MSDGIQSNYTERSPFVELLGTEGRVRIIDVFLRKHSSTLSKSEVSELAGVHASTVGRNIGTLIRMGMLEPVDARDGEKYQLNIENDLVKTLGEFHTELITYTEEIERQDSAQLPRELYEALLEFEKTDEENDEGSYEIDPDILRRRGGLVDV